MTADAAAHEPVEPGLEAIGFWRRAFSLPVMIVVLLGLVAFWSARNRIQDPDMWWHMKVGEKIVQTGELPRTDEYSYTTDHHAWIPHEWLPEIAIYQAYRWGGLGGLMLGLGLAGTVLLGGLYLLCSAYSGNPKVALIGGLIGWFFGTISLAVRPLLLGHIFLVALLGFVHLGRTRNARWLWGLPPLFAVWVNCHGSFALGLVVLATVLAAAHIHLEWGLVESTRWPAAKLRVFRFVLIACGLALLVNPIGWELAAYPLNLFFSQGDNLASISEWRPLNFQEPRGLGVFAIAALLALAALTLAKKVRLEEIGIVLLGSYLAVQHSRMVFVFGILVAPIVCRLLATSWRGYRASQDHPKINAALMTAALILIWREFPSDALLQSQIDQAYPVAAVSYLNDNGVSGNLLNEYAWGGYFIWAAPERPVFVDGRTDIFDWTGVLGEYMRWYTLQEPPNLLLDKYQIDYSVLATNSQISRAVALLPNWRKVYADDVAVVFTRRPSESEAPLRLRDESFRPPPSIGSKTGGLPYASLIAVRDLRAPVAKLVTRTNPLPKPTALRDCPAWSGSASVLRRNKS